MPVPSWLIEQYSKKVVCFGFDFAGFARLWQDYETVSYLSFILKFQDQRPRNSSVILQAPGKYFMVIQNSD